MQDLVKCCNCGFVGTVELGADKCPKCGVSGTLAWQDNDKQEIDDNE